MHQIEQNPKLGFYRVGNETFYSKPQAFLHASATKQGVSWQFNLKEFHCADWDIEPEAGLREIYRLRAQQLRDKYDYIRLEASGGSDSTQAIYSFLLNGIHLDEVIFRYPAQGEKGMVGDLYNTSATNTLSEWEFAARPLFNWITNNFPKTKVTFYDYSNDLLNDSYMGDESWIYTTRDYFQPGHGVKHTQDGTPEQKKLLESDTKICIVYGVDKPRLAMVDDSWYAYFTDLHANIPNPMVGKYNNITTELFYWTPDLPELVIKQAHLVRQWAEMPQNQVYRYVFRLRQSRTHRTVYEQLVKNIIYPDYDIETWQTEKPTNSFFNEMDEWFYTNFKDSKIYGAWESGKQYLVNNIDPHLLIREGNKPVGLTIYYSPFYYLGNATNSNSIAAFCNRDYQLPQTPHAAIKNKKLTQILIDK